MKKIITIVVAVVMLALSLTACGASSEFQGKYVNTRESKSYIEVTGEHTCNLVKVYTEIDYERTVLYGTDMRFDASSDGKTVYLEMPGTDLSIRASFNVDTKTISHYNYNYKMS